ncbi:MAG: response regulator [Syntrophobacteraceae bacterium]
MIRLMVVDDNEENLYMLQALLAGYGYEAATARHGAEALLKACEAPPDLVISDLLMPVMDGFTLLRLWKANERLNRIPFVVYTATYTDPKDERLALDMGRDGSTAIQIAMKTNPDLILLDIQLPETDGYAVARRFRSEPEFGGVPIVAVTSYAMVGDREKCIEAGCTGYIEKPIDPDTCIPELEKYLLIGRKDLDKKDTDR